MRYLIKFSKGEGIKFISHLDLMRTIQRIIRRSGVPIEYSKGFNPHMALSLAQPLSVGVYSDGEYMDIVLTEEMKVADLLARLNEAAPPTIRFFEATPIEIVENVKRVPQAMALLDAGRYIIKLKLVNEENVEEKIEELRKQKESKQKPSSSGVVVEGIDNCLVKLSKCCNPLPGDEIIGYITKGRGVSVHRKDCVNVKDLLTEENRIIDVKWYEEAKENYNVTLEVLANDRKGLLVDILNTVKETKANLMGVSTKTTKERIAIMDIDLEVENIEELNKVIRNIKKVDSVYEVRR